MMWGNLQLTRRRADAWCALLVRAVACCALLGLTRPILAQIQSTSADFELPAASNLTRQGSGGLVLGGTIFLLGIFGLARHLFPELDLSAIFEYWYVAFLAFGGWLIYSTLRERNAAREETSELPTYETSAAVGELASAGPEESEDESSEAA